jgi:Na+/proline symporter
MRSWMASNSFKGTLDGLLNNAVGFVVMGIFLLYYEGAIAEKIVGVALVAALSLFMLHNLIQHLHRRLQKLELANDPSQAPIDTSQVNYLAWGALGGMLLGLVMTGTWHKFVKYQDTTGPGRWNEDWVFYVVGLIISFIVTIALSMKPEKKAPGLRDTDPKP